MQNNNYYEPSVNFDFESIYKKEEQEEEVDYLKESIVLNSLLDFLVPARSRPQTCLLRLFSLIYITRPAYFNGDSNITQVEVAEILNCSKQILNSHITELTKKYGFIKNGMRGENARKKFSKICKARSGELAEARRKAQKKRKGKGSL